MTSRQAYAEPPSSACATPNVQVHHAAAPAPLPTLPSPSSPPRCFHRLLSAVTRLKRRCALRYSSADDEAEFVAFSHRGVWGRLLMIAVMLLQIPRLTVLSDENVATPILGPLLTTLVLTMCAVLAASVAIACVPRVLDKRLPAVLTALRCPRTRGFLAEWLIVPFVTIALVNDRGLVPFAPVRIADADGHGNDAVVPALFRVREITAALIVLAPPRFFTIAPLLCACLVAQVVFAAVVADLGTRMNACGLCLASADVLLTLVLVRVWELVRRRDFEARQATAARAAHVAGLVQSLRDATPDDASSTLPAPGAAQVPSSEAVVLVARVDDAAIADVVRALPDLPPAAAALVVAECLERSVAAATAAIRGPVVASSTPPHGLVSMTVFQRGPSAEASTAAVAAAGFARALHRAFATSLNHALDVGRATAATGDHTTAVPLVDGCQVPLRVGVASGLVAPVVSRGQAIGFEGDGVTAAAALAQMAVEDSTLVTGTIRDLIADAFVTRPVRSAFVGRETVDLHLLGMPWAHTAQRDDRRARKLIQKNGLLPSEGTGSAPSSRRGSVTSLSIHTDRRSSHAPSSSTYRNNANVSEGTHDTTASSAIAKASNDVAVASPPFRMTVCGFAFDDPDLEAEFRDTEHADAGRIVPAVVLVVLCVFVLPWLAAGPRGPTALPAGGWAAWTVAALAALAGAVLCRRKPPGEGRLLLLLFGSLYVCLLALHVACILVRDPLNPMRVFGPWFLSLGHVAAFQWLPSCVPGIVPAALLLGSDTAAVMLLRVSNATRDNGSLASIADITVTALILVLLVVGSRLRDRHLFAAVTAARLSLERWLAARGRHEERLIALMPRIAVRELLSGHGVRRAPWSLRGATQHDRLSDGAHTEVALVAVDSHAASVRSASTTHVATGTSSSAAPGTAESSIDAAEGGQLPAAAVALRCLATPLGPATTIVDDAVVVAIAECASAAADPVLVDSNYVDSLASSASDDAHENTAVETQRQHCLEDAARRVARALGEHDVHVALAGAVAVVCSFQPEGGVRRALIAARTAADAAIAKSETVLRAEVTSGTAAGAMLGTPQPRFTVVGDAVRRAVAAVT